MGDAHQMKSVTRRQRTRPSLAVDLRQLPCEVVPERRFDVLRRRVNHRRRQQGAVAERTRLPCSSAWRMSATDAIVRVTATTICGTDLHILKGDVPTVTAGRILGHEGVGIIEEEEQVCPTSKSARMFLFPVLRLAGDARTARKACTHIARTAEDGFWAT